MATQSPPATPDTMSTPPAIHGETSSSGLDAPLYRMPLEVYQRIAEAGILDADDHVVLLDGLLVSTMTRGNPHVLATILVYEEIRRVAPAGWHARKEDPIVLPGGHGGFDSVPEPDVTLVRGTPRDYRSAYPGPADVALVVEVADGSLRHDRVELDRYLRAGIPCVWIVNLRDNTVEVYERGEAGGPPGPKVFGAGASVPVVVAGVAVGTVPVDTIVP